MRERTSRPHRSARFDWADGGTRVGVTLEAKGDAKSQLALEHERLPEVQTAQKTKASGGTLAVLKAEFEGHHE